MAPSIGELSHTLALERLRFLDSRLRFLALKVPSAHSTSEDSSTAGTKKLVLASFGDIFGLALGGANDMNYLKAHGRALSAYFTCIVVWMDAIPRDTIEQFPHWNHRVPIRDVICWIFSQLIEETAEHQSHLWDNEVVLRLSIKLWLNETPGGMSALSAIISVFEKKALILAPLLIRLLGSAFQVEKFALVRLDYAMKSPVDERTSCIVASLNFIHMLRHVSRYENRIRLFKFAHLFQGSMNILTASLLSITSPMAASSDEAKGTVLKTFLLFIEMFNAETGPDIARHALNHGFLRAIANICSWEGEPEQMEAFYSTTCAVLSAIAEGLVLSGSIDCIRKAILGLRKKDLLALQMSPGPLLSGWKAFKDTTEARSLVLLDCLPELEDYQIQCSNVCLFCVLSLRCSHSLLELPRSCALPQLVSPV